MKRIAQKICYGNFILIILLVLVSCVFPALRQSEHKTTYAYGESCSEIPLEVRRQAWNRPLMLDYQKISGMVGVETYIVPSEGKIAGVYDADFEIIILFKATDGFFLHELAHVYTKRLYGDLGHGKEFCRILDRLYKTWIINKVDLLEREDVISENLDCRLLMREDSRGRGAESKE